MRHQADIVIPFQYGVRLHVVLREHFIISNMPWQRYCAAINCTNAYYKKAEKPDLCFFQFPKETEM